jgi:hypothetical protein
LPNGGKGKCADFIAANRENFAFARFTDRPLPFLFPHRDNPLAPERACPYLSLPKDVAVRPAGTGIIVQSSMLFVPVYPPKKLHHRGAEDTEKHREKAVFFLFFPLSLPLRVSARNIFLPLPAEGSRPERFF